MSVKYRDYYETLGVVRSATQEEIQRAYRKLAREHHPDVSKAPESEQRFREVGEAYEVLKDPEKRRRYDQLGHNWKAGQDFTPPSGWGGFRTRTPGSAPAPGSPGRTDGGVSFDFEGFGDVGGFSDFFESLFGDHFAGARSSAAGRGGRTHGAHRAPRAQPRPRPRKGQDYEVELPITLEEAFHGATRSISLRITDSEGNESTKTLSVKIPTGTTHGSVMRLAGQGGAGEQGGGPGDVLLQVRIGPHAVFRLRGAGHSHDLETTLPVAPWEAALGAKVEAPTLAGPVTLTIPAGSQSGQKLRLKGRGLPFRSAREGATHGDLYVELKIVVPETLTEVERDLFEKLKKESKFKARNG